MCVEGHSFVPNAAALLVSSAEAWGMMVVAGFGGDVLGGCGLSGPENLSSRQGSSTLLAAGKCQMVLHFQFSKEGRRGGWQEYKYITPDYQRKLDPTFTCSPFQACIDMFQNFLLYSGSW